MGLILLIILILLLVGALPTWGYSRNWGYRPMGGLGLVLVIVLVLLLLGYIPRGFYACMRAGSVVAGIQTTAPKRRPTPAVRPIASAPQNVTRHAPLIALAPPTKAANPPSVPRNSSDAPATTAIK